MRSMARPGTYLTGVAILSDMALEADPNDAPDNLFQYLEGTLSAFSKAGRLSYANFDSDTLARRRNPATNLTLYNIDIPRYGTTPALGYRMVGNRTHIDASLLRDEIIYNITATTISSGLSLAIVQYWSGVWWRKTKDYDKQEYIQIQFNTVGVRTEKSEYGVQPTFDPRFAEFFW